MAGDKVRYAAYATTDALSTSYSCEAVTTVPPQAYLLRLEAELTSVVTAASVLWYLAKDSAGEQAITDIATETIIDADADGTGAVNTLINTGHVIESGDVPNTLYVCASTDAGTATATTRLLFEAR
jgi:hypothetical protein